MGGVGWSLKRPSGRIFQAPTQAPNATAGQRCFSETPSDLRYLAGRAGLEPATS